MTHDSRTGKSAVIIREASLINELNDWGDQPNSIDGNSRSSGQLLYKNDAQSIESGIWQCTAGTWDLEIPGDELCFFTSGEACYESVDGERIEVIPNTLVFFEAGWRGRCTVKATMRNSYIFSSRPQRPDARAQTLYNPIDVDETTDWGVIPTMIDGESRTSGVLLFKGNNGESESGMWECTPGEWHCHVTRDEYCHFMHGECTYVHESGETLEVVPDTLAFFPKDWKGTCKVRETVRKVYFIV